MTENYTPELSSFITGKVVKFEENIIVFDIIGKYYFINISKLVFIIYFSRL